MTHDLGQFIPATAELALFSIVFAVGRRRRVRRVAALRRNRPTDHALRVVSLAGISMPTFWIALIALYVFFYRLGWFPGGGRLDPGPCRRRTSTGALHDRRAARGPVVDALATRSTTSCCRRSCSPRSTSACSRATRARPCSRCSATTTSAPRAPRACPSAIVVTRYVLRAALPSVVTVLGLVFANVLTGAVLVETIFSWPGIGQYAYQAATTLDLPAIMGVSLFVAIVYITINFIVDVLYGVIDPRIRVT